MRKLITMSLLLATAPALAEKPPITARIITADERHGCTYLGLVSERGSMGFNKPRTALEKALRKVQSLGGDGLFLVGQTSDAIDGATVTGEAYRCGGK